MKAITLLNRLIASFCAIALLCVSCTKESQEKGLVSVTFNATVSPMETKAIVKNDGKVTWSEGDKIAVYDGYKLREFSITSGAGTGTAVFSGLIDEKATECQGLYPFSAAVISGGKLVYNVPEQNIPSGQTIDPAALVLKSGTVAKGGAMEFKAQVALVKFSLDAAAEVSFYGTTSEGVTTQKVKCPASGEFYAVVTPGEYTKFLSVAGTHLNQVEGGLNLAVNKIVGVGNISQGPEVTIIKDLAGLNDFLANPSRNALIIADIDAAGGITPATSLSVTLDGQGYSIKNWSSSKGLVGTNNGKICNLTIDKSCAFQPAAEDFAPFATVNKGTLENLVNEGAITVSESSVTQSDNIAIAGIAARSEKNMTFCVNKGKISYESNGDTRGLFIGGVVGTTTGGLSDCSNSGEIVYNINGDGGFKSTLFGGVAGCCAGAMARCSNTSSLTMNAKYISKLLAMGIYDADNATALVSLMMGGVVGGGAPTNASTSAFVMEDCYNTGKVSFALTDPMAAGCATANSRLCIGGLVGDGSGPISGSVAGSTYNSGEINVSLTCAEGTFTYGSGTLTTYIGGIVGSGYTYKNQSGMNITNCENRGAINYTDHNTHTTSHTLGGIVGWPGKESSCTSVTYNCVNKGDITINTNAELRAGGIQGGSGKIDCCTNEGKIHIVKASIYAQVGGVAGFHSGGYMLNEVKNYGDITSDFAVTNGGVGGLAGKFGNSAMTLCANSAVDFKMNAVAGCSAGLVIGGFNGTTKTINCGLVAVKGSFNGTTLTESNYKDYLNGTFNYTPAVHIINSVFGDAPEPTSATVKIMSFNIRHTGEASDTGDKNWDVRKTAVLNMILEEMPDIIGVQECDKTQKDWLMDQIEGEGHDYYKHVYPGGNKCIFYKLSTMGYTSGSSGLFYHSDTPDVSSMWEGMTSARVTAWIPLVEKTTGKAIYYFNTHTDASSGAVHDAIRVREAELNVSKAKEISSPSAVVIISGDMNTAAPEAHAPFSPYFVSSRTAPETDNYPTFNGFGKYDLTTGHYLDYIYVHNAYKLKRHRTLVSEGYGVKYISDHWPVVLELEVK